MRFIAAFLFFFSVGLNLLKAQTYPQNYFRYPLDSAVNLVSPFGSIRDNHFHSGADLRTNGREGLPVYAVADGYISRIKIQRGGYGKALYIDHPNAYTSVYGHLQKYHGGIAKYIEQYQYKNQTFEFDKIFDKPLLFVKKGDTIGFSGNSGSSTGPHVHFEIRDTKSEKIINPALFGLIPFDTLKPYYAQVVFYKFVAEGLMPKQRLVMNNSKLYFEGDTWVWKDTLQLDPEMYGIGLEAYDFIHNNKDPKGLYGYILYQNDIEIFRHELRRFSFDETKYVNAHIDYTYYKLEKTRIQKCFVDDGNRFSNYQTYGDKGRMQLQNGDYGAFLLLIYDVNGNKSKLKIHYRVGTSRLDKERQAYLNSIKGKPSLKPNQTNWVKLPGFEAKVEAGDIYDTVYYQLNTLPSFKNSWSPTYQFHQPLTPLHRNIDVSIKVPNVPKDLQHKLVMVYFNQASNPPRSIGGSYSEGWIRAKASNFGYFSVMIDTVPPLVNQVFINQQPDLSDSLQWNFEVTDNFSGVNTFEAYLNNKWVLLDYDPKNSLFTYKFDFKYAEVIQELMSEASKGVLDPKLELKIIVTDARGNQRTSYFRMPFSPGF